ncbi:MAG TPA: extracellular solute-binding protein [Symbiobacteriaceae bacterium]|nr:extracellular solute-binding protein [Symbiobacteriaceae bacterium]
MSTTRRSALCVSLLLVLMFSLIGCAQPPKPEEKPDPPKPAYKGALTLWAAPGLAGTPVTAKPDNAFFDEQAKAFSAKHTDITIDVRHFATPQELEEALRTSTDLPDVAFGRYVPELAPRLASLSPLLGDSMAEYHPNALAAFRSGDKQTGLPALLDLQVLALNEARFAAAGVDLPAEGRWTRSEMEDSLTRLSKNGTFGLGFYQLPGYHEWWPLVDGLLMPDGSLAAGAEAGFVGLQRYRKDGILHPDTAKLKAEETWALFARGEFAVMPVSVWAIPLLRGSDYQMKISVAGFPGDISVGYTYGYMLNQQADELKLQAAFALARFLGSAENQTRLAAETGAMPALKTAANPFPNDLALARAFLLAGTARALPASPAWDAAELAASRTLTFALLGAREPQAALQEIQQTLQKAIAPAQR